MDFEALEDALDTLSKDKKILVERELDDLKEELAEYQEVSVPLLFPLTFFPVSFHLNHF